MLSSYVNVTDSKNFFKITTDLHVLIFVPTENEATNNKSVLVNIQKFADAQDGDSDNFIRKGIIGDHRNIMSQEYIEKFNKWWTESSSLSQGFSYSKNR